MLTLAQIAFRNASKFNAVPRAERTEERLDGAFGVPEAVYAEIVENTGSCTREQEREYLRIYNKFCDL